MWIVIIRRCVPPTSPRQCNILNKHTRTGSYVHMYKTGPFLLGGRLWSGLSNLGLG